MSEHFDAQTLAEFVAEELDPTRAAAVAEHLERCGRCQAETDVAREFFAVDSGTILHGRSDSLRQRFQNRLAAETVPRRASRAPRASRRLAMAVAVAAVVVAAIGVRQTFRDSAPPTPTGELLSLPNGDDRSLTVEESEGSWNVRVRGVSDEERLTVQVEDSAGEVVLEVDRVGRRWSLGLDELPTIDRGEDDVFFLRVLGRDGEGRRWVAGPVLLAVSPGSAGVAHPRGDAVEGSQ